MRQVNVAHRGVANGEKPVPTEVIAEAIVEISQGVKKIKAGRLNEKAMLLLISHSSKVGMREVQDVLWALENLESIYLKKKSI